MITDQDCVQAETYEYKGLSTDTKPTNCAVNSLFLELDTGIFYFFNGTEWKNINERITLGESEPTGTITITNNGIFDVHDYAEADVDVPAITPTGTMSITENGTYDVANYAEVSVDVDVTVNFNLPALARTTPTELSQARTYLAATSVAPVGGSSPQSGYALFGGGYTGSYTDVVDAYDTSLTRTTPTVLSSGRFYLTATSVGNYALFAGGRGVPIYATVDAYDLTLTRTTPPALTQARDKLASTTVGNYALFGGGQTGAFSGYTDVVEAYDQSLTLQTAPAVLSQARRSLAATTVGNYALFAGGNNGSSYFDVVDAYSETLDKVTSPDVLSEGVSNLAATSIAAVGSSSPQSGYALFGGGENASSYTNKLNAYNENLDKVISVANLSQARGYLAATNVGNYALFGGGIWSAGLNVIDIYDMSLTKAQNSQLLSQGRYGLSATSVAPAGGSNPQSGYALFGGGNNGSYSAVVDAYSPASYDIQVFPETKYSFNGSTEQTSSTWQTISMQGEVVGYMKVKDATAN